MDIRSRENITSFPGNLENSQQTSHTEKIKINWQHPINGEINEILCVNHFNQVMDALRTLAMGFIVEYAEGTCLRCVYDGYDVRSWLWNS